VDWDDLRYVLAVARAGSLADAARRLGVAHSTVYRRITAFEEAHDVKLFERSGSGYAATDAAKELLVLAEALEAKVGEAERRLLGRDGTLSGEVTLAAPDAFGAKIAALLRGLAATFPEITLHLKLGSELVDLDKREADIALRVAAQPPGALVGKKLASVAYAVYGSANTTERWVVLDERYAATPQARWEAANVQPSQIAVRASDRTAFVQAVVGGVGVGLLPCALADQEPALERRGPLVAELSFPLWILVHPDRKDVPRVRAVRDFVAARLSAERDLLEGRGV
jgi:DNA-binding transcriptional LysR family regulator